MRVGIGCCVALLMMAPFALGQQAAAPASPLPTGPPTSEEDKANQLSDQVGKLMVKCVNLLTARIPSRLTIASSSATWRISILPICVCWTR